MASEIRVNKINSRTGVGTITLSPTGVDFTGIATVATLKATTGIVTTFSATGNATVGGTLGVTGNTTVGGTLGVTGETTFSTHINLGDSDKAKFGAGGDLEIYHNGSTSVITDSIGDFRIRGDAVKIQSAGGENSAQFIADGAAKLYYDNSQKFETKSDGVDITGELQCDTLDVDGAGDISGILNLGNNLDMPDNAKIILGTGDDLQIFHDGSNSYIDDAGTGNLKLNSNEVHILSNDNSEYSGRFISNGAVELYYDGNKKFETLTNGTQTTGRVYLNGTNGGLDYNNTAHTLEYLVNGSTHSELNTGAYIPATNGGKNLGASNKRWGTVYTNGILFNGDTADANSLDDYEEGTWTPVYAGGSSAGSYSPGTTAGFYTKVGRKVYVTASLLNIVTNSAGSGELRITGLPFTPNNDAGASSNIGTVMLDNFNVNNNAIHLCSFTSPNQTYITIREIVDGGADSTMAVTDKDSDGSDLVINCTYIV